MNTDNNMEARLWEYIDGWCDADEKSVIEELIRQDKAWSGKYRELLDLKRLILSDELEQPSMRFTKNVMDEISRLHIAPAAKTYINKNIIRGLAIFFVSMIVGFLAYGFGQINFRSTGESKLPVDISKIDLPQNIDYSVFFNNNYVNAFMMLNMILGLFLLDQFLERKKKKKWQHR